MFFFPPSLCKDLEREDERGCWLESDLSMGHTNKEKEEERGEKSIASPSSSPHYPLALVLKLHTGLHDLSANEEPSKSHSM